MAPWRGTSQLSASVGPTRGRSLSLAPSIASPVPPPARRRYVPHVALGAALLFSFGSFWPAALFAARRHLTWVPGAWACDGAMCRRLAAAIFYARPTWVIAAVLAIVAVRGAERSRFFVAILFLYLAVAASYALGFRGGIDCVVFPDGRIEC
jgi:hypothetical protein